MQRPYCFYNFRLEIARTCVSVMGVTNWNKTMPLLVVHVAQLLPERARGALEQTSWHDLESSMATIPGPSNTS